MDGPARQASFAGTGNLAGFGAPVPPRAARCGAPGHHQARALRWHRRAPGSRARHGGGHFRIGLRVPVQFAEDAAGAFGGGKAVPDCSGPPEQSRDLPARQRPRPAQIAGRSAR
ncbi:hypothetical protein G6F57_022589 [Rhizopus arrhizus]|nr:hypothetical protein G6F57_022589 [Rhizopus arrhizus]